MALVGESSTAGTNAIVGANSVFGRPFEEWDTNPMKRILNIYHKRTAKVRTRNNLFERLVVLESQLQTRDLRTIREVLARGEVLTRKMFKEGPQVEDPENEVQGEDEQPGSQASPTIPQNGFAAPTGPASATERAARGGRRGRGSGGKSDKPVEKLCPICGDHGPANDLISRAGHQGCQRTNVSACRNCVVKYIWRRMEVQPWHLLTCMARSQLLPEDSVRTFLSGDILRK